MINKIMLDETTPSWMRGKLAGRGSTMPAEACMDVVEIIEALDSVVSMRGFYDLIRREVRSLVPHDMTCFCVGEWMVDKSFKTYNMVGIDWPENSFNKILAHEEMNCLINTSTRSKGGVDGNYFDVENGGLHYLDGKVSPVSAGQWGIRNVYVQSIISPQNSKSIYHCFANNRVNVDAQFRRIVKILIPHFNKAILRLTEQASPASQFGITEREMCVLRYLTLGYKNKNIATELNISIHTVKNHITNILSKLQVVNRTQAVTRAMELRLSSQLVM